MSSLDAKGKITVLKYSLSNSQDLFTQYQQLLVTQGSQIDNTKVLTSKKVDLQNQLTDLTAKVDTLNTEFNDRSANKRPSMMASWGLVSRQDWIFLIFFASYALLALVILTYVLIYTQQKVQGALMVALVSTILGITTGGVLKYFA
jgi:hypothetical protein